MFIANEQAESLNLNKPDLQQGVNNFDYNCSIETGINYRLFFIISIIYCACTYVKKYTCIWQYIQLCKITEVHFAVRHFLFFIHLGDTCSLSYAIEYVSVKRLPVLVLLNLYLFFLFLI